MVQNGIRSDQKNDDKSNSLLRLLYDQQSNNSPRVKVGKYHRNHTIRSSCSHESSLDKLVRQHNRRNPAQRKMLRRPRSLVGLSHEDFQF
jgi:hypothetical protein